MKNVRAAFFYLWSEVQPAASASPAEMNPGLIDVGAEVDEVAERRACPRERAAKDRHPRTRKLERYVLLAAVGEEIAEQQLRVDLELVSATLRCGDELTNGGCRTLGVLSRLEVSRPPLVTPDCGGQLKGNLRVIALEIEQETEVRDELGAINEELRQVVFPAGGQGIQPKQLARRTTRPRRHPRLP